MTGKETGVGKITYSKMELAKLINTPYPTLVRTLRELTEDGIIKNEKLPSGQQQMEFALEKYHQGIVKVLLNHEQRIESNEEDISELKEQIKALTKEISELKNNKNSNKIII